ncbi:MAG: hypothetical protein GTO46_02005 [Gemmatimonadetes bacterium]|nr:hypothetical protein [Gemmatimonadota bacterium]NIO30571.1 hypothetical protein [Gemmatimonadota bacterium]
MGIETVAGSKRLLWTCPRCGLRFASVAPKKRWPDVGLWLTRRVERPEIRRVEEIVPRTYTQGFRFEHPAEIDEEFAAILGEAYTVGCQEHLTG